MARVNKTIVVSVLLMSGMGLLALWSQAPASELPQKSLSQSIFLKQLTFLGVALGVMGLVAWPNYQNYRHLAFVLYGVLLVLLGLLLVKGTATNGARCWFSVGPLKFQPAEIMKVAYVLVLASVLRTGRDLDRWKGFLLPLGLTAVPAALIVVQPDLGMTLLFIPTLFAMLYTAGARKKHLILLILLMIACVPGVWMKGMKPYQKDRVVSFLFPGRAPDHDYQRNQSIKACSSGAFAGQGIGDSGSGMSFYIPERHTDFVFSVIAQDMGFVGSSFLLLLIGLYFTACFRVARDSREPYGKLLVVGLATISAAQTCVNLAMTLGVAPITGLTLPFVSYGGSSLVMSAMSAGLILNVGARWQPSFSSREMAESSVEIRDFQPQRVKWLGH